MTGYGRGEIRVDSVTALAEIRMVNSRFLEVSSRLPRTLTLRENDVRDIVRTRVVRGKVNVAISIMHDNESEVPLRINSAAVRAYMSLLNSLRKAAKIQGRITLDHLLKFPEVLEVDEFEQADALEWSAAERALTIAIDEATLMRRREGNELMKDLTERIQILDRIIDDIDRAARQRIPDERTRLTERLNMLVNDRSIIDEKRLELEVALIADKLDVTEECVRFRSHNKYFRQALTNDGAAGRKLTFLVQEMNREANTIGAKADSADIAHMVVTIKEELEKIREQLQNIE